MDSRDILSDKFGAIGRAKLPDAAAAGIMERVRIKARRKRAIRAVVWTVVTIAVSAAALFCLHFILKLLEVDLNIFTGAESSVNNFLALLGGIFASTTGKIAIIFAATISAYIILGEQASERLSNKH